MSMKTEFKWFTITQYEQEQEYLRDMHRHGWKLTRIGFPGFYQFTDCEPEDVVYQLDYNQNGTAHRDEYTRMFADCGWEYMFDFVGYSYFRKPAAEMNGEEEIFCDDESRLEMMQRVLKGRLLPLLLLFCCIVIPQTVINGYQMERPVRRFFFIFFLVMALVYIAIFTGFTIDYLHYKKKLGK